MKNYTQLPYEQERSLIIEKFKKSARQELYNYLVKRDSEMGYKAIRLYNSTAQKISETYLTGYSYFFPTPTSNDSDSTKQSDADDTTLQTETSVDPYFSQNELGIFSETEFENTYELANRVYSSSELMQVKLFKEINQVIDELTLGKNDHEFINKINKVKNSLTETNSTNLLLVVDHIEASYRRSQGPWLNKANRFCKEITNKINESNEKSIEQALAKNQNNIIIFDNESKRLTKENSEPFANYIAKRTAYKTAGENYFGSESEKNILHTENIIEEIESNIATLKKENRNLHTNQKVYLTEREKDEYHRQASIEAQEMGYLGTNCSVPDYRTETKPRDYQAAKKIEENKTIIENLENKIDAPNKQLKDLQDSSVEYKTYKNAHQKYGTAITTLKKSCLKRAPAFINPSDKHYGMNTYCSSASDITKAIDEHLNLIKNYNNNFDTNKNNSFTFFSGKKREGNIIGTLPQEIIEKISMDAMK